MITRVIDNFTGALTRRSTGQLNSGLAKFDVSYGYEPFSRPSDLTWVERPTSILSTSSVMVAMKSRVETQGLSYVYGVNYDNTLYRITVNSTGPGSAEIDSPSVIGTLDPAMTYTEGGSMVFYGNTEKIFVGGNETIVKVDFSGANSASIAGSFSQNVPRPQAVFLGKNYFGNENNIGEIDSTETVTTFAKLSPGFPKGTYVRDLDVTPDGNYLQITVARTRNLNDLRGNQANLSSAPVESYKFYWNGKDTGYTAFETYNGTIFTSNVAFSDRNYTFGYDLLGAGVYNNQNKELTLPNSWAPHFGASFSLGNLLSWAAPEYVEPDDKFETGLYAYGQFDKDTQPGLFRLLRQAAVARVDVGVVSNALPVSNLLYADNSLNFTDNIAGTAKFYYSTLEEPASGSNNQCIVWKFKIIPTGSVLGGVWESQNELFSKKVKPAQLRLYTEPFTSSDQSFKIEFVDVKSSVLGGQTFTVGISPVKVGDDYVWWDPKLSPGYSWGTRITNLGTQNWVGIKMEIDFMEAGK